MAGSVGEISDWMGLARQSLGAARMLLEGGYYRDSVSKSYYAMFYAAKATVLSEGIRANKHSTVVSSFGQRFGRTGRVPPHLHKALAAAFEDRQSADYRPRWQASQRDAEIRLAQAEEFVSEVARMLFPTPPPNS